MKKLTRTLLSTALAVVMVGTMAISASAEEIYMFINQPEYADAISELIDAYAEVAPDVTINYETTQNDYPTLLKAKLNSGEVPDIFASTSGKEIDVYKEYSYDLTGQPLEETILPSVASAMQSTEEGGGLYGIAIKGNYFGLVYNKGIFDEVGIPVPETVDDLTAACEAISAAGYTPFTTGYAEWWVFKHIFQHYLAAAADGAGTTVAELVQSFEKGEVKIADLPEIYNNFFDLIDLSLQYGDAKPLETDLSGELAAYGSGTAAMVLGQGAWIEADALAIDPELQVGFSGYPVTNDAAQCKIISGSDQALHVAKDSAVLQATLDFINWWYTSDYGIAWFTDVAGVVPPVATTAESDFEVIKQGSALENEKGSAPLGVCYSTDSWWQKFGELMQDYIAGTADKDATCAAIEENWKAIDGQA
ncbi:MAG: extracellular solute-binding protein [Blautia sp.]|nr:extracellular solute-binding protein [Blautia sp.]